MPRYRAMVYTNCKEGSDEEFNRWYNRVHVREVIERTQIEAAQRFMLADHQSMEAPEWRYLAIYEFSAEPKDVDRALVSSAGQMNMSDTLDQKTAKVVFYEAIAPEA